MRHQKPLELKEDEWVFLKFPKARLCQKTGKDWQGRPTGHQKIYPKLSKRYYGPFQILERINETSFRLNKKVSFTQKWIRSIDGLPFT